MKTFEFGKTFLDTLFQKRFKTVTQTKPQVHRGEGGVWGVGADMHRTFCVLIFPFLLSQHLWANSTKLLGCMKRSKKKVLFAQFWKSQAFYIDCTTSFLTCDVPTSRRNDPLNPESLATCGCPCIYLKSLLNVKDSQSCTLLRWPTQ